MVKPPVRLISICLLGFFVLTTSGCLNNKRGKFFCYRTKRPSLFRFNRSDISNQATSLFLNARRMEQEGSESCVDLYFEAAALSSEAAIESELTFDNNGRGGMRPIDRIYRSSLAKFISTSQSFRRYHPQSGILVHTNGGNQVVPVRHQGFPGPRPEFHYLIPAGSYSSKDLNRNYRCCGAGLSLVAINCNTRQEPFRRESRTSNATALLHCTPSQGAQTTNFVLDIYDPIRVAVADHAGRSVPLRRDLTAPMAYVLSQSDQKYLQQFFFPGGTQSETGLFMVEPYQRGKIPILFVHGLLSDPLTWVNMANEIRSYPDLMDRYQIWGFEYPTGQPFLKSAADLRQQLAELRRRVDPTGSDQALSNMMVVGHSMGGLIAKLQVADSGDQLWQAVSYNSLANIRTNQEMRRNLDRAFYFRSNPAIRRVVFIGTPHQGSPFATRPIGLLGSNLIEETPSSKSEHQALVQQNPNNFSAEFRRRIPTSIDMLRVDSCLLKATNQLRLDSHVQFHTIYGSGFYMLGSGDSDSVVPVSSARFPGSVTERALFSKHTKINKSQQCVEELISIMRFHLAQSTRPNWQPGYSIP